MEFKDIREIKEMTGAKDSNLYLAAGWVLLNTVSEREGDSSWFLYSLGWPKDSPAEHPKLY